jgi:hypothetical protein
MVLIGVQGFLGHGMAFGLFIHRTVSIDEDVLPKQVDLTRNRQGIVAASVLPCSH